MSIFDKIKSLYGIKLKKPSATAATAADVIMDHAASVVLRTDLIQPQLDKLEEIRKFPQVERGRAYLDLYFQLEKFIVEHEPLVVRRKYTPEALRSELREKVKLEELPEEFRVLLLEETEQVKALYKTLCESISKSVVEILGTPVFQRYLNQASSGTLLEGIRSEGGKINLGAAEEKISELPAGERKEAIAAAFQTLFSSIYESIVEAIGRNHAKGMLEESYRTLKERHGVIPYTSEIPRIMPIGVLEEEKLALTSREELEQKVRERIAELKTTNEQLQREITERKRAEAELRKSEERYRGLVETMNEGLEVLDENNVFTYTNDRFCKMLGYSRDEIIGRPITDFVDKLNQNILKEQRVRRRKGERGSYELVWTGKDGQKIFTIISAVPILGEDGNYKGSFAVVTDITELKRTEEKIKQAAKEWETTFNSISDLVSIQDKNFKIVRVNKAYAEALKMKPEELIGKICYEVLHGTKEPWPNCPHKQALETKKSTKVEFFEPRLGIHLEASASPILDEKGEVAGILHIVKDITERKKAEEDRLKAVADKQRMEELEKFAKIAVGRELKMLELKERIKELESRLEITEEG